MSQRIGTTAVQTNKPSGASGEFRGRCQIVVPNSKQSADVTGTPTATAETSISFEKSFQRCVSEIPAQTGFAKVVQEISYDQAGIYDPPSKAARASRSAQSAQTFAPPSSPGVI
jgi:hypothetical protein